MSSNSASPPNSPSGFAILAGSRLGRAMYAFWERLNELARLFLPLLHIAMVVAIGVILFAVVFANQHAPCWLDEICMLDPAWHRTIEGVWRSVAQWDSINTIPFAPNYPLFINFLRSLIAVFGVNFHVLRGAMLILGLAPIAALLWLFHHKGLLQSTSEVIQATYFTACFSLFFWAIYIRPEALLLSVITLLVFAWKFDYPILLFISALLVPVYGLQWNVLLLPVFLHWLIFGGRIRNPLLVAVAFGIASVAVIVVYHHLGMWPSFLQQVADYHSIAMNDSAAAQASGSRMFEFIQNAIYSLYSLDFARWFGRHRIAPPLAFGLVVIVLGGVFCTLRSKEKTLVRWGLFLSLSVMGILFAIGLLMSLGHYYVRLALAGTCLFVPVVFRETWNKRPLLLFLVAFLPLFPSTLVLWHTIRDSSYTFTGQNIPRSVRWLDEPALEGTLSESLSPMDTVCCADSAYFAIRSRCRDLIPLCYAFDMSTDQIHSCSALLIEDNPVPALDYDYANWRKSSFSKAIQESFLPEGAGTDSWSACISPDDLVAAISAHWHCTFTEIPLALPEHPNTIRFRLFRPVFSADSAS